MAEGLPQWSICVYSLATTVRDPGPDGKLGTADDGPTFTAYGLSPAFSGLPVINITTNLPENSIYYTWEITATKRDTGGRWSLLASFAKTWSYETPLSTGSSFTPNQFINTVDGLNRYNNWQAKIDTTLKLKWDILMTPIIRAQSRVPFGRTFVTALNYGSTTILAEPFGQRADRGHRSVRLADRKAVPCRRAHSAGPASSIFTTSSIPMPSRPWPPVPEAPSSARPPLHLRALRE
jgi:hypothetical protein